MPRLKIFLTAFLLSSIFIVCKGQQEDTIQLQRIIRSMDSFLLHSPGKASELGQKALQLLNATMAHKWHCHVHRRLGESYMASGNPGKGYDELITAISFADTYSAKGLCYNLLGVACLRKGDLNKAIENLLKSVSFFEKSGESSINWGIKQNLAICYAQTGQLNEALKYFKEVLDIQSKLNTAEHQKAESFTNMGVIYEMLDKPDSSLIMFESAYAILQKKGNSPSLAMVLNNLASVSVKLNKRRDAFAYLEKSFGMMLETGDVQGAILTMNNISDMHLWDGKYQEALRYASRAYAMADSLGFLKEMIASADKLSLASEKAGNIKQAYFYCRKYIKLNDSLIAHENFKQITEMQAKYEAEKKEKEIALLNKDKQLQDSRLSKEKTFRYFIIGVAALVMVIAVLLFYSLKNKQKTNRELDLKNKKIQMAYATIEEKQEEILDSIRYAKRIQQSLLPTEKYISKSIKNVKKEN